MNTRNRDGSTDDLTKEPTFDLHDKRPSPFYKTADVDDPPFSRLFLLIPKAMSEDELRQAFVVHGTIPDIYIVRDRRSHESNGLFVPWISFRQSIFFCSNQASPISNTKKLQQLLVPWKK